MWSDRADEAYKRLTRTITVPAGGATLSFWTSYNLELDFDYMIVEAHTVGQDNWTTLPDRERSHDERPEQRSVLHGRLEQSRRRGQRAAPVPAALPDVRSGDRRTAARRHRDPAGEWNAANGSSSGWQQFEFDLPAYAGQQVEISITVAERLGLPAVPGRVHRRHRGLHRRGHHLVRGRRRSDGRLDRPRRAPGRRRGSRDRTCNDWVRRGGLGIKEGAAVATGDRTGTTEVTRSTWASASRASRVPRPATEVMGRAIDYLLRSP